jgi:hypothetical protein
MTQVDCTPSLGGIARVRGLEEEVLRLRRAAVAELLRREEPAAAKRRAIQLLRNAARLDEQARRVRARGR